MRANEPGQPVLLMPDVADALTARHIRYAVIGALATEVHGAVRASMDAGAIVAIPIPEAQCLRSEFEALGPEAQLRVGDNKDPVVAPLALKDSSGEPQDITDARSAIAANPESLTLELLRGLALRFGRHTALPLEALLP